ncbi:MAG: PQQ-binding-like beta-propeller repeat protein [Nevskiaceae bacterium]|jgi:polyvinyl alcohol dehydrogenase (cytochrome)|nr:PQQ-binding-like beta-propeller repeat protein [Nevskiaceae bacterium]
MNTLLRQTLHTGALILAGTLIASCTRTAQPSGEQVYTQYCAACHDQPATRAPPREALAQLSPQRILRTLDFGTMMAVAYPIRRGDREVLAQYLGKGQDASAIAPAALCSADRNILAGASSAPAWKGWSPTTANTAFQPREASGLSADQVGNLRLKWAFGYAGDFIAFAAPTVSRGTLFVGSAGGAVHALDAQTGCTYWTYQAKGPVRTPPTLAGEDENPVLLFTDQVGGVYALEARTGREVWTMRVEEHEATRLSGAITVHEGIAFVPAASWEESRAVDPKYPCCTFRGSVSAVRISDGSVAWKTWLVDPPQKTGVSPAGTDLFGPSGVGVWSAPTVDAKRGLLYIGTGDNYTHPATPTSDAIVALDLQSGAIRWIRQTTADDVFNAMCARGGASNCGPDHDFAAPAMLVQTPSGRDVLIAGQKSGVVYGLDPDDEGRILWETRIGVGGTSGGVQWGMASDGSKVYASVADPVRTAGDQGSLTVGNAPFDPAKGGGLTALDVLTGNTLWHAVPAPCAPPRDGCSPAQPAAVSVIAGAVFSGSMDGHIRAFSADDGRVLWDFDTQRSFTTVNGVTAQGGSIDGPGAVVVNGMVYVNSGYPRLGGAPGNVLLAFGIDSNLP